MDNGPVVGAYEVIKLLISYAEPSTETFDDTAYMHLLGATWKLSTEELTRYKLQFMTATRGNIKKSFYYAYFHCI